MALTLHYFPTPNGRKIAIALEEMGLSYEVTLVDILEGEQQRPEFLAISPNGRIPAIVDDGLAIFESGAILQYLGRKTGLFYPADEAARTQVDAWLFWQMAGLGPMTGQVTWFTRAALKPERDPRDTSYAIHRFTREVKRLYSVLDRRLEGRDHICGDYSIADMACWPWVNQHHSYVGALSDYPNIDAWHDRIGAKPAVCRAMQLGMERRQ